MRFLWVNLRLALRWVRWYLTGRRWLVPQTVNARKLQSALIDRVVKQVTFMREREKDNRSLLTGMTVALVAGHTQWLTGWERYKYAARPRSYYSKAVSGQIVGRPVVYDNKKVKVGVTEWSQNYTPRREALAARGRRKYL